MAKSDWDISGDGGQAVIEDAGSMRCRLTGAKLMLWNGRSDLANSEIIAEIKMGVNSNTRGGLVLRSDTSNNNFYRLTIYGKRTYYVDKIVGGISTQLGSAASSEPYNIYVKTRFRIDEFQLSVEEFTGGQWNLVMVAEDTSHAIASGYAGLHGISVSGYSLLFDNVEISERT